MIRPRIPIKKNKPAEKIAPSFVFDSANEIQKVAEIVSDLERLKANFLQKINNLEKLASETKIEIAKKLEQLSDTFKKTALLSLENDTQAIIWQYENAINKIEKEIEIIKTIQKGDKGETGEAGKDGKDGFSPNVDLIVKDVLRQITLPKDGKDAVFDEKSVVKKTLDKLLENGLDIKNIKHLEETLRHLSSKVMLGGAVKGGQGSWKQKNLSGTIDGVNTVFTYTGDPFAEFSEHVYLNYIPQNPFTDYTIVGNTITYTVAPDVSLSGLPHIIRGM